MEFKSVVILNVIPILLLKQFSRHLVSVVIIIYSIHCIFVLLHHFKMNVQLNCTYLNFIVISLVFFLTGFYFEVAILHGLSKKNFHEEYTENSLIRSNFIVKEPEKIDQALVEHDTGSESLLRGAIKTLAPSISTDLSLKLKSDVFYKDTIGSLPNSVSSWRAAQIDWHHLLPPPQHLSSWERFGKEQSGSLRLLVSKEEQLTDYLTRFHESGLASKFGRGKEILP
jgi:hypothetical protein